MTKIYMGYFEGMTIEISPLEPTMWLRYVKDTFILWLHQENVQILQDCANFILPSIQFTIETEAKCQFAFFDVLNLHIV